MRVLLVILLLAVSACATPKYNYQPETTLISAPPLNAVATAYVGEEMVSQGNISQREGIVFETPQKISGYSFSNGFLPKTGEDEKSEFFTFIAASTKVPTTDGHATMSKNFLVDPLESVELIKESNKLCAVTIFHLKACRAGIPFKRETVKNLNKDSFQQTLLYSGRVGDKINVSYREYSGDTARPAFNNQVEYDLSESKQIAYRGALITILEADNQKIQYIVDRNFNKAEY